MTAAPEIDRPELNADTIVELLSSAVAGAFTALTTKGQEARDDLLALTMSGLGGCTRQAAYRLSRTPPSEELTFGQMREANIGTMIHEYLLPHMAKLLGGVEEIRVTLRVGELIIEGRSDLYSGRLRLVGDLKTVGMYKYSVVDGASQPHRMQVAGYALAAIQSGREVEWIAWVYLDRSSGAEHIVVEQWSEELVELVEQRCADLAAFAEEPDAATRDERGPGLSYVCDGCPWLRECWGPDAERGVVGGQSALIHDHAGVAQALALYDRARAREKDASDEKEFARAMFSGFEPGDYGDWSFRWSSSGTGVDKDAAVAMLADAGIPVPTRKTSKRLVVKRSR
jgi:hypothetical protein